MKITMFVLLSFLAFSAHAEITDEQIAADCLNVKNLAAKGNAYYKQGQYGKAREQFELQAAWSESCDFENNQLATAYNNVAMTYVHEKDFLKARAWLARRPEDKKSIYNLQQIQPKLQALLAKSPSSPVGEYWRYSGKAMWDVITIKKSGNKYSVHFEGYYAGLMAMYYGPNIGEFSTDLQFRQGKARYSMKESDEFLDCVFDLAADKDQLRVTLVSGSSCGFGHNVSADGDYHRVAF